MKDEKKSFEDLTRREFLYLSGVGVGGTILTGISGSSYGAEKKPKYGGRLRWASRWGSMGLDAHRNQDMMDYKNYCLMYGALTEQGPLPQVEIYPMLAKSWEISKDGREFAFSLRAGVRFHHGKELDSSDVKYSIERVIHPATKSPRAFAFKWVDSVDIIDKYHLRIRLKEPFAPFLTTLTVRNCPIIPSGWQPTGTKPAPGTGPFIFKSFIPNETTEFTRFDQYWEVDEKTGDRLPYLDSVYMKKIVDENVRLTALRAGDIEGIEVPPLNVLAQAVLEKPIPGIFTDYESIGSLCVLFNTRKPPFDNKKVRQAIAYALNKKEMVKAMFWGLGETLNDQPISNNSRLYIPVKEREVDLARAKQLLAEAGYPNGFKTEFLQYSVMDRAPYYTMMRKGEFGIGFSVIDARFEWDDAYYMLFHSGEIGKNNWTMYSNKELDALLEKGRITWNQGDRLPIYKKVVEILQEDLPILFLFKSVVGICLRDYIKGYRKGFATRFGWHGGGPKYWWFDK